MTPSEEDDSPASASPDDARADDQETQRLLDSIPGMKESIIEGMHTPIEECSTELDW